jgi:hypothetical protein
VKSYSVYQDGVLIQRISAVPINFVYCATIVGLTSGQTYSMTVSATDFNNNDKRDIRFIKRDRLQI